MSNCKTANCELPINKDNKFCPGCGAKIEVEKQVEKPVETQTPAPISEEEQLEKEFNEFIDELTENIYLSFQMNVDFTKMIKDFDYIEKSKKFEKFLPIIIKDQLVDNKVVICSYEQIILKEHRNIYTKDILLRTFSKRVNDYFLLSATLTQKENNKFTYVSYEKFKTFINSYTKQYKIDIEKIHKFIETTKLNIVPLL